MNVYQTLARPWHAALDVWIVLARAQADFAMRLMWLPAPRPRVASSSPVAADASPAVAAETPAEPRLTLVAGTAETAPRVPRAPRRARQSKRS